MISFGPTEEQEVARDAMREFAASAIRPIARRCDEASQAPAEFLEQAWQLGLVATQIPEAFGGGGEVRSPITNALVLEELAHGDAGLALAAVAPARRAAVTKSSARGGSGLPRTALARPHHAMTERMIVVAK